MGWLGGWETGVDTVSASKRADLKVLTRSLQISVEIYYKNLWSDKKNPGIVSDVTAIL